jgi:uncharacterized membrane protein (UPF0127 family)
VARLSAQGREVVDRLRGAAGPVQATFDGRPVDLTMTAALSLASRSKGLLGATQVPDALLLHPCSSVHSIGMRIPLEVAYLDRDLVVVDLCDLPRWRMHLPRRRAVAVLEAQAGQLSACGAGVGSRLGVVS